MYRIYCLVIIVSFGCSGDKQKLFSLLPSTETGIDFINQVTDDDDLNIIEYLYFYNGGGVAIGDINNDGLQDIYFTSNQGENKLFLNQGNFKFRDITSTAGVAGNADWSTGVTMADVNGDGWLDIYVSNVANYKGLKGHNELFINSGDLTFSESSEEYGLNFSGFGTQSAFFDYDRDGDLDVYLLNHAVHTVHSYTSSKTRLTKDDRAGDRILESQLTDGQLRFRDVTSESGIYSSLIGYGLGIAVSDINLDGWADIYVSNDFHENDYLYINQQDGTFKESLELMMGHTSRYSMGNDVADINNDGNMDVMTLDMLPKEPSILLKSAGEDPQKVYNIKLDYGYSHQYARNTLQLNMGNGQFADIALLSGVYDTDWSWAPLIADFDNNGLNDIFIANGIYKRPNDLDYINYVTTVNKASTRSVNLNEDSIENEMIKRMPTLKIANFLYANQGSNTFADSTAIWGLDAPSYSNGAAYGDLDNDGDLDLIINNVNQSAFVYRNNTNDQKHNNYIQVVPRWKGKNPFGYGTKVICYTASHTIHKELQPTRGFQSSVEPQITLGIGKDQAIDSLKIIWPNGDLQTIKNLAINQKLVVEYQQESQYRPLSTSISDINIINANKLGIDFKHTENSDFQDYDRESLIPYKMSTEGPAVVVGDINGDGLDDIFAGGSKGQMSAIYLQNKQGEFDHLNNGQFSLSLRYEDVDAALFDADNDGDQDLYVVSGGGEFNDGSIWMRDRLYFNNGEGMFPMKDYSGVLPESNGSCVRPADFDQDGDIDLFVGTRSLPGLYGKSPDSYLLINDGQGNFTRHASNSVFDKLGMVTDAEWADIDGDGDDDLLVVGDWMPVTILVNNKGSLENSHRKINKSNGWWRNIEISDIDGDGDVDIIAGNFGLNNKLYASLDHPLALYLNDFDHNGQIDPLIFHHKEGKNIPFATKNELAKQIPALNKKFNTYAKFSKVDGIESLFTTDQLSGVDRKYVYTLHSSIYRNDGRGNFKGTPLPQQAQYTAISDFYISDLNNDQYKDVIFTGNFFGTVVSLGRLDALPAGILSGGGNGNFVFKSPLFDQIEDMGEYREIVPIRINNKRHLIFARNNDSLNIIQIE